MQKDKVLLAGATGYLGRYLASELNAQQYPARLIVRNKAKTDFNINKFEVIEAEVTKPETLADSFRDIDIVISSVGITKQKDGLTYMDVDYQANKNLLDLAVKNGVRKFIYVGVLNGKKLTDLKMVAAKEKFVDALEKSGIDYCVIRPNGFFSDMSEFFNMGKKGAVSLFGTGEYKSNPIHGEDLARFCVESINRKEKELEVGGPEILTHNEIAQMVFDILGKKPKVRYLPNLIRKFAIWGIRTFTSVKTYGPVEFFMTVLAMDMIAPKYGKHTLRKHFEYLRDAK